MGPPDKIQYSNKGNLFFETKIWHTEQGDIVKQTITEDSSIKLAPPIRNLQKELADAIENEDYEKAAIIRDEINNKTKNK